MAFFEQLFPPGISAKAQGGPKFITEKAYSASGRRSTNRLAQYPLHEYTIAHPVREGADFEVLRAFFWVVGGDADAFRYQDWADYKATASNSTLTLVSGSSYQLGRIYSVGSRSFTRPIQKPAKVRQVLRTRASVVTDITSTTTVDLTTGLATITGHAAGDTYAWAGTFHVPVAFKDAQAVWSVVGTSRMLTEWPSLELEEVRL